MDRKISNTIVKGEGRNYLVVKSDHSIPFTLNREYIQSVCIERDRFCCVNNGDDVVLDMSPKKRDAHMKQHMVQITGFERRDLFLQRQFWNHFRKCNPHLDETTINIIRKKCNDMTRYKRSRVSFLHCGLNKQGKPKKHLEPIPFQQGTFKDLPHHDMSFVPVVQVKSMPHSLLKEMKDLQEQLIMRIRGGAATRKPDARDSNRGHSIAYCVVGGGRHASKERGISGSLHINNNITGKGKFALDRANAAVMLQCRVFALVTKVIVTLFGGAPWFKATMEKLSSIPRDRFIPGGRIPCSHIWFTADPKSFHIHTDTNTIPPAFVFCVESCIGGDLLVTLPNGEVKVIETTAGRVAGGKWAQLPHCNTPVICGTRHSFVCYLDHRAISTSWLSFTTKNGFDFYNTVVNELLKEWGF